MKFLIYGGHGWIGSQFIELIKNYNKNNEMNKSNNNNINYYNVNTRVDNMSEVLNDIDTYKPTHILSFIGRTHGNGFTTIDYLEQKDKLNENIRDNLYGPLSLALICKEKGIHYTYIGTGCIFSRDEPSSYLYTENDIPDFFGSSYSTVKGFTDRLFHLTIFDNVLNVRIRMPITADLHPRNFITKIITYEKVCSNNNSMTVLPSLLPELLHMVINNKTGTVHLTNPGYISHNEILQLYKEIVDPNFVWKNFTIDEQNSILLSKRSNNCLDTHSLENWNKNVLPIKEAIIECLYKIKHIKEKSQE